MSYVVNIRDRRQITIPANILKQLSLSVGDKLSFNFEKEKLVVKPLKTQSLDTLKTIQKVFNKSKLSEEELQKSGLDIRKALTKKLYG